MDRAPGTRLNAGSQAARQPGDETARTRMDLAGRWTISPWMHARARVDAPFQTSPVKASVQRTALCARMRREP
jgi:hypothetical protein